MCRSALVCVPRQFRIFAASGSITIAYLHRVIDESTLEYKTDKPLDKDALRGLR